MLSPALGQEQMRISSGLITFDASSSMVHIAGVNDNVKGTLDLQSGELSVEIFIEDFQFRKKLMQKHFNEKYLESQQYPKAVFWGTITGLSTDLLGKKPQEFQLSGELTIHGNTQPFEDSIQLSKNGDRLSCSIKFIVRTEDHKIKVPRVLFKKVAEEANISAEFELSVE